MAELSHLDVAELEQDLSAHDAALGTDGVAISYEVHQINGWRVSYRKHEPERQAMGHVCTLSVSRCDHIHKLECTVRPLAMDATGTA